ncbi:PEPxxWA-CTERM sorting domain-containing protein [Sphingomonas panacisoli]|nr:PEPxxWA-CTERM sorting domain-containing protein [Sphingomonas panacisoli]
MKRTLFALAASALAIAAASPASAGIFIGVSFNGGPITQVATDSTIGSANFNTTSNGFFFNTNGTGFPLLLQPNLLTQSVNIQQAGNTAGTLSIYITQTDLAAFNGFLTSTFTSNTIANANVVLSSYYSAANALFGGTLLQSATFGSTGVSSGTNALNLSLPYSQTVRYDITFGSGLGNFNGTGNLTATTAVPEPASWALMMFGFAGLGYAVRRRPKTSTRIRFT